MHTITTASDTDRFGDLTDDLLSHVLSFLPSDDALQTCVLDTRWRDLLRRTTSLHFNVDYCERFRRLVKLIIQLRGKSPLVKCDIITCPDDYAVHGKYTNTKLLIEFALKCQVKELILSTVTIHMIDPPVFDVPFISHHLKTINLHQFIYRWDLEWCPIFSKLKTLLLNEWFTAIDLACILQHSPILEMLTLQLHNTKSLTRATTAQETVDQSFVCAHLKVVNIECDEVHEEIHKIVNILRTCGILRDHISIKTPSSPSYCFSFQKDPQPLLPLAAPGPAASTTADGN
ncbi:hypothetical protein ACQJBY_057409 [Aegilops geniculata]